MSLIMDATKAAQREKERREGKRPDGAPLLVPLKARPGPDFNWRNMLMIAGSGVVLVAAGTIFVVRTRGAVPRALRTPGPTVVSLATPTSPAATARDSSAGARQALVATNRADSLAKRPPASQAKAASASGASRTPVTRVPARAAATDSANAAAAAPAAQTPGGQLRIAVEQPRELEAARLFAAGVAAHRNGDLNSARALYEQVLVLVPSEVDALNNLGVLHTARRDFDRAEAVLRRALSLAPANAGAWNNLGTVLRERGRSADAIAAFQRALALDTRHQGARVSLAQQYLMIGALPQARQLLEDVLAESPAAPEASYALGQVLERQGDRAGAIRAYGTFIRVAPPTLAPYVDGVRRRVEALSSQRP